MSPGQGLSWGEKLSEKGSVKQTNLRKFLGAEKVQILM